MTQSIGELLAANALPQVSLTQQQLDSQEKQRIISSVAEFATRSLAAEVPEEYRRARLRDFAIDRQSLDWSRYGWWLTGNPGIGKTHLASALAAEYFQPANPCAIKLGDKNPLVWVAAPALLVRIRSTFGKAATESEQQVMGELCGSRVLVLDDLGAERHTDFSSATLYAIISERRNRRRITIVTSNQALTDINAWEPRIASRLAEFATITLPDTDRRIKT